MKLLDALMMCCEFDGENAVIGRIIKKADCSALVFLD
jgi:hypothetical protein